MDCLEICAGAGGQALGLENAGFVAASLVEIDPHACQTLRLNRPHWLVYEQDVQTFNATKYRGIELFAGGVPCPPFSVAGKQLGSNDERDLFPTALRIVDEARPLAVMLENVRGFLHPRFAAYRDQLANQFKSLGYTLESRLLHASDYQVSQLRPRVILVAIQTAYSDQFRWPKPTLLAPPSVGQLLGDLMAANNWQAVEQWQAQAATIAPTIVGGSKKHGGPDLGPSRARHAWAALGVDGRGIADEAPKTDFNGMPRLTNRMVARLQGFPDHWQFAGKKTAVYRQIGNAFPPPVAAAVAHQIRECLEQSRRFFPVAEVVYE